MADTALPVGIPATAWIWLLAATSVGGILTCLRRPEGAYHFPYLAAATFLGFILPQLPALAENRFFPDGSVARTTVFATLCLLACTLGWRLGPAVTASRTVWCFDERRLLIVAGIMSVTGAYFFLQINALPHEVRFSVYSGLPVVYIFFARLLTYGFAIALILFLRRPSLAALLILAFDAAFYADRLIVHGRRAEAADFVLLIALAFWFQRGRAAPRVLSLLLIVAAAMGVSSTGEFRAVSTAADRGSWTALRDIDVAANFQTLIAEGGQEVGNAVRRMHAVQETGSYDYGLCHWNMTVFNYVPAQLVGADIKQSLTVQLEVQVPRDYAPHPGTTDTGLSDAFASLSYFGALKFALLSFVMRRLYVAAMTGSTASQIVYALSLTPAMHAITHHTQWPISAWIHMLIFLLPALSFARVRRRDLVPIEAMP
jgi:hypothetical protein